MHIDVRSVVASDNEKYINHNDLLKLIEADHKEVESLGEYFNLVLNYIENLKKRLS